MARENYSGIDPGKKGFACIRTGRKYIGFELNTEYYDVCIKRIINEDYNLFR